MGHGEKPAVGVPRDGVHLDCGIADIQVEVLRQFCAVEQAATSIEQAMFAILRHHCPETSDFDGSVGVVLIYLNVEHIPKASYF